MSPTRLSTSLPSPPRSDTSVACTESSIARATASSRRRQAAADGRAVSVMTWSMRSADASRLERLDRPLRVAARAPRPLLLLHDLGGVRVAWRSRRCRSGHRPSPGLAARSASIRRGPVDMRSPISFSRSRNGPGLARLHRLVVAGSGLHGLLHEPAPRLLERDASRRRRPCCGGQRPRRGRPRGRADRGRRRGPAVRRRSRGRARAGQEDAERRRDGACDPWREEAVAERQLGRHGRRL